MGSPSANGLQFIMNIEQIPLEEQPLLVQKLLVYINTALKVQQKEKGE